MAPWDLEPDEEDEACQKSKPRNPRPKKVPKKTPPSGHLPPLDQIQDDPQSPKKQVPPNQTGKRQTRRCAKCGERALSETIRQGRCLGCQVEAYLSTL